MTAYLWVTARTDMDMPPWRRKGEKQLDLRGNFVASL